MDANTIFAIKQEVEMTKNQTITYQPAIEYKRVEAAVTREIKAPVSTIFPLACPVEELRWIPEWSFQLIYTQTGVNETNCIFNEYKSGLHLFEKQLATTWVTSIHDPDRYHILFHLNFAGKAAIRFDLTFREVAKKVSSVTWQMVFTALDEEANAMPEDMIREKMELMMTFLAEALKHYCETGEMIK